MCFTNANQIHVWALQYYMQPILAHTLVHHIYKVEEMGTDRYANGVVEKWHKLLSIFWGKIGRLEQ